MAARLVRPIPAALIALLATVAPVATPVTYFFISGIGPTYAPSTCASTRSGAQARVTIKIYKGSTLRKTLVVK